LNPLAKVAEDGHSWWTVERLGNLDLAALRLLLVQPSYLPSPSHTVVDDETILCPRAHELTVEGYNRQTLTGCRVIKDEREMYLETPPEVGFGDLEAGERVGGAVLYEEAGSDRLSPLLQFWPLRTESGRIPGTNNALFIVPFAPYSATPRPIRLITVTWSPQRGDPHDD
jgi:hypothetical protein